MKKYYDEMALEFAGKLAELMNTYGIAIHWYDDWSNNAGGDSYIVFDRDIKDARPFSIYHKHRDPVIIDEYIKDRIEEIRKEMEKQEKEQEIEFFTQDRLTEIYNKIGRVMNEVMEGNIMKANEYTSDALKEVEELNRKLTSVLINQKRTKEDGNK